MKTSYEIDPAHSSAQFTVRHMMITNVRGGFSKVTGSIVYDPGDASSMSVHAEIEVDSISTLEAQRDGHLKSPDFLDAASFPKITFQSTRAEKIGAGEWNITGDLTIRGTTRSVVLNVDGPALEGKDPWGNIRTGASVRAKIARSDFGLKWNTPLETGGFLVGDDVKIDIEVQLIKVLTVVA